MCHAKAIWHQKQFWSSIFTTLQWASGSIYTHTHKEKRIKSSPGVEFSLPYSGAVAI